MTTDSAGMVEMKTQQGTMIRLGDRYQSAVMARLNPDGSVSTECFDEQDGADQFVARVRPAQNKLEVK